MIIKIKEYINNKRKIKDQFKTFSKYLDVGEYKFNELMTYVYKDDPITTKKAFSMLENSYTNTVFKKSKMKYIFNWSIRIIFFNRKLSVKEESKDQSTFSGSLFLPAINGKEVKIFNLNNNEVLLLYFNHDDYHNRILKYNRFKEYFHMPEILNVENNSIIIEKFIDYKPYYTWTDLDYEIAIKGILKMEKKYISSCIKSKDFYLTSVKNIIQTFSKEIDFADFILDKINKSFLSKEFPFVTLHGDLWTSNILIEKNDNGNLYCIDWEHSKEFIAFYDIFFMIINESFINSNNLYLKKYIMGEYDKDLDEIFSIFNMSMEEKYRYDYLYITIILQYMDRWTEIDKGSELKINKKIKEVINYIENFDQVASENE